MASPAQGRLRAAGRKLRQQNPMVLAELSGRWATLPEPTRPERQRLYSLVTTFWLFLAQVLSADGTCREAVRRAWWWMFLPQGQEASPNNAAYCQARKRLPLAWLEAIHRKFATVLEEQVRSADLWLGHRVKIIDGSAVSMPDTADNQRVFPQSVRQKPGCGFPLIHFVALFSLATGALLEWTWGSFRDHERTLFHRLWDRLQSGDVVLSDRGFCGFADFWVLAQRGIDCVMRKHHRRGPGSREVQRLGRDDRLVEWCKMKAAPKWLEARTWVTAPQALLVREIAFTVDIPGFRTRSIIVATTLLDHHGYPAAAFADLYRRRWLAELCFRDVKTTLGMEVLRCKSPTMIIKEMWMFWIAYNLLRLIMFHTACTQQTTLGCLSFKGTLAAVRQATTLLLGDMTASVSQILMALAKCIAHDLVPSRPNRSEPRAVKRRPKNYARLTSPRHEYKEIKHRNKYRKSLS
jgi:hypothetical protein